MGNEGELKVIKRNVHHKASHYRECAVQTEDEMRCASVLVAPLFLKAACEAADHETLLDPFLGTCLQSAKEKNGLTWQSLKH